MERGLSSRVGRVAALLLGSGFCALVYQTAWHRELRLVFGASHAASAAVLAIFMGGLGVGSLWLSKRAERHPRPLELYGNLEILIASSAAVTPALTAAARWLYVLAGGSSTLGTGGATIARLLLATAVLGVPTFLMGGTLPAAARAVASNADAGRRNLAVLYGVNTIGAVLGTVASTFALLEIYGTRKTLWLAALLNVLVGLVARVISRSLPTTPSISPAPAPADEAAGAPEHQSELLPPFKFVLAAAGTVGFVFLLMELVWYRMLGPLLGGSTFTFGIILAVALLGIGVGGALYSIFGHLLRPTLSSFAATCSAEAACVALPFALGDHVAVLAAMLRPLSGFGFFGLAAGWVLVAALVVLPASIVAGFQFPLLIALMGRGREQVARHVGLAYAWNTFGSIAGSLAGGFGLLPMLTAPGTWRLVAFLLIALAACAAVLDAWRDRRAFRVVGTALTGGIAAVLALLPGPTSAWRHSPIGAGRVDLTRETRNGIEEWRRASRRNVYREYEGLESSVALVSSQGLAFFVNGKSDGHSVHDAATQVMSGLIGTILHPEAKRALVIGLGTGSTAGWIAAVPSIEHVDAVEFEPAILDVARRCEAVNHGAMSNPKVKVAIGDGREFLLTARDRYDLIVSEPSNPYRAGIASLFTVEYYEAARERLSENGLFLQWFQAYEVDGQTIRTVFATLAAVFEHVETWTTQGYDLVLVASRKPISYDAAALRARIAQEPYRSALFAGWRVADLEGFLGRFLARSELARAIAELERDELNRDDHPLIEFAVARSVGRAELRNSADIYQVARASSLHRPHVTGDVDWVRVEAELTAMLGAAGNWPRPHPPLTPEHWQRIGFVAEMRAGNYRSAWARYWRERKWEPSTPLEVLYAAELLADRGEEEAARPLIERARALNATEGDILDARLLFRLNRRDEALKRLESALVRFQSDPWANEALMTRGIGLADQKAHTDAELAERLYALLEKPFAQYLLDDYRKRLRVELTWRIGFERHCVEAFEAFEPNPIWSETFLERRAHCYQANHHALAGAAKRDLERHRENQPERFGQGLMEPTGAEPPAPLPTEHEGADAGLPPHVGTATPP